MAIQINHLALSGVVEIIPDKFIDDRGFFSEIYNFNVMKSHGIDIQFVQDNQSLSKEKWVLRGLHFQCGPYAQAKLVRVVKGSIYDVAVDIRRSSPNFGKWVGIELSAEKWNQLLVPAGFAHGFLTLETNCEVAYKVSQFYSAAHDCSIRYDDPEIGIKWPLADISPIIQAKDAKAPLLKDSGNLPA